MARRALGYALAMVLPLAACATRPTDPFVCAERALARQDLARALQATRRRHDCQRRAHGSLRRVLVCPRMAKTGGDQVIRALQHAATLSLDRLRAARLEAGE